MSRRSATVALAAATFLAGCGALDPFPTLPRAAGAGQPAGPRVAICYNTLSASLNEVQHEAQRQCPANTLARPVDTDWYLLNCPLLLPARATFVCARK